MWLFSLNALHILLRSVVRGIANGASLQAVRDRLRCNDHWKISEEIDKTLIVKMVTCKSYYLRHSYCTLAQMSRLQGLWKIWTSQIQTRSSHGRANQRRRQWQFLELHLPERKNSEVIYSLLHRNLKLEMDDSVWTCWYEKGQDEKSVAGHCPNHVNADSDNRKSTSTDTDMWHSGIYKG